MLAMILLVVGQLLTLRRWRELDREAECYMR